MLHLVGLGNTRRIDGLYSEKKSWRKDIAPLHIYDILSYYILSTFKYTIFHGYTVEISLIMKW